MAEQALQALLFPMLLDKPLIATLDTLHHSSDGGAILLKAIDDDLGPTTWLAACLPEWRQTRKIEHDLPTLIRRRCFGLTCGYAAANDAVPLALGASPGERHAGPICSIPCGLSLGVVSLAGLLPPRPAPPWGLRQTSGGPKGPRVRSYDRNTDFQPCTRGAIACS